MSLFTGQSMDGPPSTERQLDDSCVRGKAREHICMPIFSYLYFFKA